MMGGLLRLFFVDNLFNNPKVMPSYGFPQDGIFSGALVVIC